MGQTFFGGKSACFEDGDKFRYSATELLRATATKLGPCDKHPLILSGIWSSFFLCSVTAAVQLTLYVVL